MLIYIGIAFLINVCIWIGLFIVQKSNLSIPL
jgi:hypothetical protein